MKIMEARDQLPTSISTRTTCRQAHNIGFNNWVAIKKPFLSDSHLEQRLQFSKDHASCMLDNWRAVLWTDESSFEISKTSQQAKVWQGTQTKYEPKNLAPTFKSGRTLTMVWGSFFSNKKGPLIVVPPGQREVTKFIENVYKKALFPYLQSTNPLHQLSLMEDNAPVHTAKASGAFLAANSIKKLIWPAQSPDLNPIKNVWFLLKSNIQELYQPQTVPEMHKALTQAWEDFPDSTLDHLVQ